MPKESSTCKTLVRLCTVLFLQVFFLKDIHAAEVSKINTRSSPSETEFLFIGTMEHSNTINNLSEKGLFHSLLLADYLYNKGMPSKGNTAMYALFDVDYLSQGLPDLAPLQALQYYSVYKIGHGNGIITSALKHNFAGDCVNPGNCKVVDDLIKSSKGKQRYVFSMPNEDINDLVAALQAKYSNFEFDPIPADSTSYNVLLSVSDKKSITAQTINDGISTPDSYPPLVKPFSDDPNFIQDVGLLRHGSPTVKYSPLKSGLNKNETVYLVRHVEKYADTGFDIFPDDGNYGCIGEWRALFNPESLHQILGYTLPDFLYAPNPTHSYGKASYVRATTSIAPYSIKFNKLESFAPEEIGIDGFKMYKYLFYADQGGPDFNGKTILVSWESLNIEKMMLRLSLDFKNNPFNSKGGILGSGWLDGFENVIKIVIDSDGNLSVESLYEGISTTALRESKVCPTGFSS
ncbi:hypothetical protein BN59_00718 [Legionella massiliensis]|uniref:Uncharacterized protein n=1 Tax=Legionella massiliensis TaxID=1034943 RepID=A0A078KXH0_9GAMM|nr:hypothetical protein [Legionella massiliensis]CDZ76449.1 hypothetical protein BN59_00718 [Legionella massiliensis]CEE12187.1 hypothetical protein BN1094_00718 [Legionella massiliensis]